MIAPAARFLALGDSYTIGEGVDPASRWPAQLARRLDALGLPVAVPEVVARTGWTAAELSAGIDAASPAPPYDLVTVLVGVNDQYRGLDPTAFGTTFAALLERAVGFAAGDARAVLAVSIPDWGVTRFAREHGRDPIRVAEAIDVFNARARTAATAAGIAFCDVTAISRDAGDADAMLVADGLHPSAAQYALWSEALLPPARAALASTARASGAGHA